MQPRFPRPPMLPPQMPQYGYPGYLPGAPMVGMPVPMMPVPNTLFPPGMGMPPRMFMPPPMMPIPAMLPSNPTPIAQFNAGAAKAQTSHVVVGAPVMTAAVQATPIVVNAIMPTNSSNSTSVFLNQHIFQTPLAGLPLTLFIGNVPLDMEDVKMAKLFECCGKVNKYIRPSDPLTQTPTTFALVTYAQAICALRCMKIFDGHPLSLTDDNEQSISARKIVVKAGSREKETLAAIAKRESDAAQLLSEGKSLADVYDPIKQAISRLLAPSAPSTAGVATQPPAVVSSVLPSSTELKVEPAVDVNISASVPVTAELEAVDSSYYDFDDDEANGPVKEEKVLLSEIEKFRLRQQQRDKELEEQRRQKIKERILELTRAKPASESNPEAGISNSQQQVDGRKRPLLGDASGSEENTAELEIKRQRKLQVLRMLANDESTSAVLEQTNEVGTAETAAKSGSTDGKASAGASAVLPPTSLSTTSALFKLGGATKASSAKPSTTFRNVVGEDVDDKPLREIQRLDYTEDELQQIEAAAFAAQAQPLDDDDEDVSGNNYKRRTHNLPGLGTLNASLANSVASAAANAAAAISAAGISSTGSITGSVHAKVLAQAQAISAALAARTAASSAMHGGATATSIASSVSVPPQSNAGTSGGGAPISFNAADSSGLKRLVDQIPTARNELFSYAVDWKSLETRQVIDKTMRPWVSRKMIEYLGEEEESLTAFIVQKLKARCLPQDLLNELTIVLDEDSEPFCLKLWRMLIYHSLKQE